MDKTISFTEQSSVLGTVLYRAFPSRSVEYDYQEWRIDECIPHIRVGETVAAGAVITVLIGWFWIQRHTFPLAAPVLVYLDLPLIAFPALLTFIPQGRKLLPSACKLGILIVPLSMTWVAYTYLEGDGRLLIAVAIGSMAILIGFLVVRVPPVTAAFCIFPVAVYQIYAVWAAFENGEANLVEASGAIPVTIFAFFGGLLLSAILETSLRRAYIAQRTIERQQEKLEEHSTQLRRYLPSSVAKHIIDGDLASVDTPKRQRITVLFCDIVDFTDMADRIDPEALTDMINQYMDSMSEIIEKHGGTLNEFAGDGLMSLFGAPNEVEAQSQVINAIQAAWAMHAKLPLLSQRWLKLGIGKPVSIRVGINTGVLSVGSFGSAGRMTYTAIGIQTNIAARIQSLCTPGGVLLSDTSWQLVQDIVPCEPRGEVEVKGVHYPLSTHAVLPA